MQALYSWHAGVWRAYNVRPLMVHERPLKPAPAGLQDCMNRPTRWQDHSPSRKSSAKARASSDPADALTETLGGISKVDGRVAAGNNLVLGGDNSLEKWRELDAKVNEYPTGRVFKAIGSGGDDFVRSMASAIKSVTHVDDIPSSARPSAKGNYISATLGPVMMESSDQVVKVYERMREDRRLRWYL